MLLCDLAKTVLNTKDKQNVMDTFFFLSTLLLYLVTFMKQ